MFAYVQIKVAGMKVKDFYSFIEANQMLDKLYRFAMQYQNMSPQEQVIYLAEAEKIAIACIERLSENPWEDKEDIESAIDSVMIYDTLEDLDVTTSNVEKMQTLFVD